MNIQESKQRGLCHPARSTRQHQPCNLPTDTEQMLLLLSRKGFYTGLEQLLNHTYAKLQFQWPKLWLTVKTGCCSSLFPSRSSGGNMFQFNVKIKHSLKICLLQCLVTSVFCAVVFQEYLIYFSWKGRITEKRRKEQWSVPLNCYFTLYTNHKSNKARAQKQWVFKSPNDFFKPRDKICNVHQKLVQHVTYIF